MCRLLVKRKKSREKNNTDLLLKSKKGLEAYRENGAHMLLEVK